MKRSGNFEGKMNGWGSMSLYRVCDTIWRPFIHSPARSSLLAFFFLSLLLGAFLSTRFLDPSSSSVTPIVDSSVHTVSTGQKHVNHTISSNKISMIPVSSSMEIEIPAVPIVFSDETSQNPESAHPKLEFPLECSETRTCPRDYPERVEVNLDAPPPPMCPDYFRWIYEDLRPWKETGITSDMVERAKKTADFKLVILNGKAYVERYRKSYQTRDVFTLWGIMQLLRKYPGRVPDLEFMFDCVDWPVIQKHYPWPNGSAPPLFRYCGDDHTLDIVFPDWSFWGWAEINIKPWEILSKEIKEGNKKVKFMDREPYAYWKGNPFVAPSRLDLLKCNVSDKQDWGARIYIQDWAKEGQQGFKQSNLADQCVDRYKIYIEGSAWSVSEKYILACDSVTLIVKPKYYDFFSRGLMPTQHYWPVRETDKCKSIKFAVDWSNSHKQKAQAIGKAASDYIHEDMKMDYVYDYMLHLLTEYAKLLKYKPTMPKNAVELCSESLACTASGFEKEFMTESLVTRPSETPPCTLPPPYNPFALHQLIRRKVNVEKQVEKWEKEYWNKQTKQQ